MASRALAFSDPEVMDLATRHFIPVAEESGLIVALTDFVLQRACHQLKRWQETGSRFADLGRIIREVGSPRVKVCLDTQHSYAAGYDLASAEGLELAADRLAPVDGEDPRVEVPAVAMHRLRHLHRQLPRGAKDEHLGTADREVDPLDRRNGVGGRFAGAGLRLPHHIMPGEQWRDGPP